jgi:hypothetical protein
MCELGNGINERSILTCVLCCDEATHVGSLDAALEYGVEDALARHSACCLHLRTEVDHLRV